MDIRSSIRSLPGVGETTEKNFAKLGIFSLKDLLLFMPRRYRDFSQIKTIEELKICEPALTKMKILSTPSTTIIKKGLTRTSFQAGDKSGILVLVIFNQAYAVKKIQKGIEIFVYGKMQQRYGHMQIDSPEIFFEKPADFMPVYPLTRGIRQPFLHRIIREALQHCRLQEFYTPEFLKKIGLQEINESIKQLHFPLSLSSARHARDRLVFDELIVFCKTLEYLEEEVAVENGEKMETAGLEKQFIARLPFALTRAQRKVLKEIAADLSGSKVMNRLVQGDVGSGKTVLAFFAMFCAAKNGYQSVLMAPTEILAQQHFEAACRLFGTHATAIVTGSLSSSKRLLTINKIENGEVKIIIGTHALIHQKTKYQNLGLIITDEQHRFGVRQRAALSGGKNIHMLTMSATPIPRTLSLVLYGNTDISVVDELPPGRQPVNTYIIREHKYEDMLSFINRELSSGRQAYIVCPLIEEDESSQLKSAEETYRYLSARFKGHPSALLHGKLKNEKKQYTMKEFSEGKLKVIISTTVIEVGINVPNATVMCIMNAERFGLAQLHQLRGRVGRGEHQAYCFLVSDDQNAFERLAVLCATRDGFEIAKKDMELRGTGDLFGTRQHGQAQFSIANILFDANMLSYAKDILNEIKDDPEYKGVYRYICALAHKKAQGTLVEIALN
jgi:ATP-dependent DNA helicase RecG